MKINYMEHQINSRFDSFKSAVKRLVRGVVRISLVTLVGYGIYLAGGAFNSTHRVEAVTVEAPSPILDRIADCESGSGKTGSGNQIGKSGQTLISLNTNGTYDIGKYQINSIHNAEATKLGFNLMTEEGNYGYAKYLYQNKGTGDWSSSAHCWQK